jgi:hypothetical protein
MMKTVLPVVLVLFSIISTPAQTSSSTWLEVPPADFSKLKPSDFSDDELDLPFYLAQFHRVANSVVADGEDRGFINIAVWRNEQDNRPYNARIMENILSLAFFYATNRPWNQYYGSPAVRVRLEAALDFWCRIQSPDGRFSEYGPQRWNLAATAFATKFMGETLTLLRNGPPIDPRILDRVVKADRKAIHFVLTDPAFHKQGTNYTNQFTNVWAGGLAYVALYPDPTLENLLRRSIIEDSPIFQSRAGYFYEAKGPDWSYNLGTHHSNLWMSWHYARGKPLGKVLVEEERKFVEWLSYNAVREPDGSGYTLNRGIETRQRKPFLDAAGITRSQDDQGQRLIASLVPLARAFAPTQEDVSNNRMKLRAALVKNWPPTNELQVGTFSAFSPYAFLHRGHVRWFPTVVQRNAAIRLLPYLQAPFIQQRMDDRERVIFTFVCHPAYYAIFNSGPHLTDQQRYGLGLVWDPEMGTLIQSQTGTINAAWGTVLGSKNLSVYEAATLNAEFNLRGTSIDPRPGIRKLPSGSLTVTYAFTDQGEKILTFAERQITVQVQRSGPFHEQIPLLVGDADVLKVGSGQVTLTRGGRVFSINFDPHVTPETVKTDLRVGQRQVVTVNLQTSNNLSYVFSF